MGLKRYCGSTSDGGVGDGGAPAAHLAQRGRNNSSLGLFIGLELEDAGVDWALAAQDGDHPVQASASSVVTVSGRFNIRLPAVLAEGAAGNQWTLWRDRNDDVAGTVSINRDARVVHLVGNGTLTVREWEALLVAEEFTDADISYVGVGGGVAWPFSSGRASLKFSGGVDGDPIEGEIDTTTKTVRITYRDNSTLQQIADALDGSSAGTATLRAKGIHGTNMSSRPVDAPFDNVPFREYYAKGAVASDDDTRQLQGSPSNAAAVRSVQQVLVAYGRFADSELINGSPPDAGFGFNDVWGMTIESGTNWELDPTVAEGAGGGSLWRTESTAIWFFDQWLIGAEAKTRVPAGATLYATDDTGANASEVPPAGWTHFGLRRPDGGVVWLPKSRVPASKRLIWNLTSNFTATGNYKHLVAQPYPDLADYQFIEIRGQIFNALWQPTWEAGVLVPADEILTAAEVTGLYGDEQDRSLRVYLGSTNAQGTDRIQQWEIISDASGYTYTSMGWGFRQTIRFEHNTPELPAKKIRAIGLRGGGLGSGNLRIYGIP